MIDIFSFDMEEFETAFSKKLSFRGDHLDVRSSVFDIIEAVKKQGDEALIGFTSRFDKHDLTAQTLRLSEDTMQRAVSRLDEDVRTAIDTAHYRIFTHHERQKPDDYSYTDPHGNTLGWRWSALDSVGLYVPGGTASYPSSVLMNGVPARVAGVRRLTVAVPAPYGRVNPAVLYAASKIAADDVYLIGGAQAIAALAYGTETIAPVDKIVGPGNAFVAEAKRQVFGHVGIDMIAGPSEVLIVADDSANPRYVAADMMAQAEHDPRAQSLLLTTSPQLASAVCGAIEDMLPQLERADIIRASLQQHGGIFIVSSLEHAADLANRVAAEHLEIMLKDPHAFAAQIRHAGALFLGGLTPEAIGDYNGGSNHVLPTGRSARFSSGLGIYDFLKRTSVLEVCDAGLRALGPDAITLAQTEHLDAHALSVQLRLDALSQDGSS